MSGECLGSDSNGFGGLQAVDDPTNNGENQSVRSFLSFNNVSEEVRAFFPKPSIAPWLTASFCASSKLLTSIIILFFGLYLGKTEITEKSITMKRPLIGIVSIFICLYAYFNL